MNPIISDPLRHDWVDYAKGICMVAVVAMYINSDLAQRLTPDGQGEAIFNTGWFGHFVAFARPFRMPDFFLLSGLFLGRVIHRPWRNYLDSRVVHYLYFFVLWTAILCFAHSIPEIMHGNISGVVAQFIEWLYEPFAMLWFVEMLAIYSLVTRLTKPVPVWLILILAAALQISQYRHDQFMVEYFGERYVYFFVGYAFAAHFFKLADWVHAQPRKACAALCTWALINGFLVYQDWAAFRGVGLALGFAGACAVIMLARLLSHLPKTRWLRYIGKHSLVIYLGFYLPMAAFTKIIGGKPTWIFDFGSAALLIAALSITSALLLFWGVRYTLARVLFERPAWARLVPSKPANPIEND